MKTRTWNKAPSIMYVYRKNIKPILNKFKKLKQIKQSGI